METVKCKYCSVETTNTDTEMCHRCWEFKYRIENNLELAKKIIEVHSQENVVFQKGDFTTITGVPKNKWSVIYDSYEQSPKNICIGVGINTNILKKGTYVEFICNSILPQTDKEYIEQHENIVKNMKLIAAAPDLLEACQKALEGYQFHLDTKDERKIIQTLTKAIKKATK